MEKSPINSLQEFTVRKFQCVPTYQIKDVSTTQGPKFECICIVHAMKSCATSSTKKVAKTSAAEQMMRQIGMHTDAVIAPIHTVSPKTPSSITNYIGFLNEHSQQNSLPQPTYAELQQEASLFQIQCQYKDFTTIGKGANKKTAKAESAQEMVKLIKNPSNNQALVKQDCTKKMLDVFEADSSATLKPGMESKFQKNNDEETIEIFQKLRIQEEEKQPQPPAIVSGDLIDFRDEDLSIPCQDNATNADLKTALKAMNVRYEISTLQDKDPVILCMTLNYVKNGTTVEKTLLECGQVSHLVLNDLLSRAIKFV